MRNKESSETTSRPKISQKSLLVLLGACIICFMTTPYLSVFGLLYKEKLESFNKDETAKIGTWTFAIYLFTWNFVSLFVGPISQMQSHRWTTTVGIFLMGSGSILSAFANTPTDIFLAVGLIIGSGQGLVTNTTIIVLTEHFKLNPGLALGLVFMVMALAGIITPQLDRLLLAFCSGQTSILVHGSLMLALSLFGAIFLTKPEKEIVSQEETGNDVTDASHPRFNRQPLKSHLLDSQVSVDIPDSSKTFGQTSIEDTNTKFGQKDKQERSTHKEDELSLKTQIKRKESMYKENEVESASKPTSAMIPKQKKPGTQNPIIQMFTLIQWSLLKDPYFLLTALGSSYSFNALINFYLLLPLHAESQGCSVDDKSVFLSVVGVVDLFTRFLFAWMGDWNCIKVAFCNKPRRMLYALSVIGIGVALISLTLADNYSSIMAVSILYGIFAGGIPGNGPLVYSESFQDDFVSAMGLASIGRALAALSTGPLTLFSKNKDFGISLSLWFHGGISILLMLLWISESVCCSFKRTKNQQITNTI